MSQLKTLQRKLIQEIQKPSSRTKQVTIGPSAWGGCPYCVGQIMAVKAPKVYPDHVYSNESGLGAWIGTQVHTGLEDLIPFGLHEQKFEVCEIPGYGVISGHVDHIYEGVVTDYKVMGKYGFDKMALEYRLDQTKIPTTAYRVQQMTYCYAARKAGHEITHAQLMVFPKVSNRFEDIKFYSEPYNEEVALRAIDRTVMIWNDYVLTGKKEELPASEDCYNCSRKW